MALEKFLELFSSFIGGTFTTLLQFNDEKQALLRNLEVLRNRKFDIDINMERAELSGKKRKREVEGLFEEAEKLKYEWDELDDTVGGEPGIIKRWWHGSDVKKLKERAEQLIQQTANFRDQIVNDDTRGTRRERFFPTTLHGESVRKELEKILTLLESDQVSIFGICGMGGVGKTTLANHICNKLQGTPEKWNVYWITVSQEADINKLQNDLAEKLDCHLPKDCDVQEKAAKLRKCLRNLKNVVLILDDVWEYIDLTNIGMDPEADKLKVIVTSRRLNVCHQIGCKETFRVQPLSEEDAWTLFLEKLEYRGELSPEVEKVAMIVAKKCKGLPLGIITLARSMSGVYDIHEWRDLLEDLNSSIEQNDLKDEVFPVLRTSFDRLRDSRMQKCFLYCSLYPEDYEIPRDELIFRFIYEGMMRQRTRKTANFDQGHALLNRLISACLLESVVIGKKLFVKMHDLLREMAVDITRNQPRFLNKAGLQLQKLPCEDEWTKDLESVSLMNNKISKILKPSSPKCPRLSTLILRDNPLELIQDSFFAHMHGLRVLDLRETDIKKLPNIVSELENLTALLLGGCKKLYYVPPLRKLESLMELDINETQIKEVPKGMENLVKLKCLNMEKMENLTEFPKGLLPRLSHLERLRLPFHIKIRDEEMERLEGLEEFHGCVDGMLKLEWIGKSPALSSYLIKAGGRRPYSFRYFFGYRRTVCFDEFVFKTSLDLPLNIESIDIIGCKGDCLLNFIPSMYLKGCFIGNCNEIECIMRISATDSKNDEGPLQNLESFLLSNLENFIGWFKWEERARALPLRATFSSLKNLLIQGCHKMKILFPNKLLVNNLRNLELIEVQRCYKIKEIIADEVEDEDVSLGLASSSSNNNNNEYTSIITFPKLRWIILVDLPQLESIYKGVINCCDSIRRLEIRNCPKLERVAFFNPSLEENPTIRFPMLSSITVIDLPELKNICNGNMVCDKIEIIEVWGCRQLRRLPLDLPLIDGQPSPPPDLKSIRIREEEKE